MGFSRYVAFRRDLNTKALGKRLRLSVSSASPRLPSWFTNGGQAPPADNHPTKTRPLRNIFRSGLKLREVHRCAPTPPSEIALCFQAFAARRLRMTLDKHHITHRRGRHMPDCSQESSQCALTCHRCASRVVRSVDYGPPGLYFFSQPPEWIDCENHFASRNRRTDRHR